MDPNATAALDGAALSALSGSWRIWQTEGGHRWSTDDVVVADWALRHVAAPPRRVLDLGTGTGSVGLMLAWYYREAEVVGIEAQARSVALAAASVEHNGLSGRVRIHRGDIRDELLVPPGQFDLVTGTPPYIPLGAGTVSGHLQRAYCRFEIRGGVETYCSAAARAMSLRGGFALVHGARATGRIEAAAHAAGLQIHAWRLVEPRTGREPLLSVYWMTRAARPWVMPEPETALVVRDGLGRRTPEMQRIRGRLGMPENPPAPA